MSLVPFENSSAMQYLLGVTATAAAAVVFYKRYQEGTTIKNGIPLPPGPPARWFWENALPAKNIARTLAELVAEYGPVVSLRQGRQVIVVVGRVDAANEIMEKEGSVLVDRPHSIAAGEILSQGYRFLLVGAGERFRRYRKASHAHLAPKAVKACQEMQLEYAKAVITDILNEPKNHITHVKRYAASVILRLAYGKSARTSNDDPEVVRIHQTMANFQNAMRPGAYLVDRVPLLRYIPGYGDQLRKYHEYELSLYLDQMNRVKADMAKNEGGNSFMRTLLERVDEHQLSRDEMAYLVGNMFGAGSETTAVAITNMILAAACYPETQKRVQEELDRVIGKDRLPTWEDAESLPQVNAFVMEILRWRPVIPIGFPHKATKDIFWKGQWIPAGATVIGCHWAISQDPVVFPEPEKFNPQRWIGANGKLRKDMNSFAYGFGRRICPGIYLANHSLFINCALLFWSFSVSERPDAKIDVNAYSDTVTSNPAPFEVDFAPRVEPELLKDMVTE